MSERAIEPSTAPPQTGRQWKIHLSLALVLAPTYPVLSISNDWILALVAVRVLHAPASNLILPVRVRRMLHTFIVGTKTRVLARLLVVAQEPASPPPLARLCIADR